MDPFANATSGLVIYGPPTSRVTKVMWAAAEVGQSWVDVGNMWSERKAPWYLALNPKGTVPTLPVVPAARGLEAIAEASHAA